MRDLRINFAIEPKGFHKGPLSDRDERITKHVENNPRGPTTKEWIPDDQKNLAGRSDFAHDGALIFLGDEPLEVPIVGRYRQCWEYIVGIDVGEILNLGDSLPTSRETLNGILLKSKVDS